jgi:hypothetical protein
MAWSVEFHEEFEPEFWALPNAAQREIFALAKLLEEKGPHLGRPHADTLNGSSYKNMKELRFKAAGGVWRVAYAFDPRRTGILLTAGDKSGMSETLFYDRLIERAERRYKGHLKRVKK